MGLALLTLNLANPTPARARDLLEWLWHQPEPLWVLTEVGDGAGSRLVRDVCQAAGYLTHSGPSGGLGVLLVARSTPECPIPWTPLPTEHTRLAAADVDGVRVLGVYGAASDPVRYSSSAQRARKRAWLEEFDTHLDEHAYDVVVGDLNLVAPTHVLPYTLPEETAAYHRIAARMPDAYQGDEASWVDHSGAACRYDHAFTRLPVASCTLDHEPRTSGLTDHSALRLELE